MVVSIRIRTLFRVISRESVQSFASSFFVSVFRLFIWGAYAEGCVHLIGAGYLHGGTVAAVLDGDAYVPQSVGYFGGEDKYESLGFVYNDILHRYEYFLGRRFHGSKGDADGGIGACQFDVSPGESDVLTGLGDVGGGTIGGAELCLGAIQ